MSFGFPEMLFLLLLLPLLFFLLLRSELKRRGLVEKLGGSPGPLWLSLSWPILAMIFMGSLVGLAARPQYSEVVSGEAKTSDYILLADVSRSTEARWKCGDPSVLDRSKKVMLAIIGGVPEAKFSIGAFGNLAFILTQLTNDHQYLREVIEHGLYTGAVPIGRPGSRIDNALEVVAGKKIALPDIFGNTEYIVLFTDGGTSKSYETNFKEAIEHLRQAGIKVIAVGIGDTAGIPVPVKDKDGKCTDQYEKVGGQTYYSYLRQDILEFIARETGGKYFSEGDTDQLISFIRGTLKDAPDGKPAVEERKRDMSWPFLVTATVAFFGIVVLSGRRK